jgi:hypothetical protein
MARVVAPGANNPGTICASDGYKSPVVGVPVHTRTMIALKARPVFMAE